MAISKIQLDPDVVSQYRRFQKIFPDDLITRMTQAANQAARIVLNDYVDRKLQQEQVAFEKMHAALVQTYLGKYVAIHDEALIDSDTSQSELARRVYHRFPNTPIGIFPVNKTPEMKTHRHFDLRQDHGAFNDANSI